MLCLKEIASLEKEAENYGFAWPDAECILNQNYQ